MMLPTLRFLLLSISPLAALALPTLSPRANTKFNHLVAFGDELTDNGSGSFAHGITGDPANVYGFGTWTNGPVAAQYLSKALDLPLEGYAWGGCCGGGSGGATINDVYTPAAAQWNGKPVPSIRQQIRGAYSQSSAAKDISTSLQFVWTGLNDVSAHTDAFWEGDPANAFFAANISARITNNVEFLLEKGAPAVMVANIYPKHLAPVTKTYLCPDGGCVETWGQIIETANAAIETALSKSKYADRIIYYDVFSFMTNLMQHKDDYGLTAGLGEYCDGDPAVAKWDECIAGKTVWDGAKKFFWMNFVQPTTTVHGLIGEDMAKAVKGWIARQ